MKLSLTCPNCRRAIQTDVSPESPVLECACGWRHATTPDDWSGEAPARCLVCSNQDLWRQKDFPQRLGLIAIAVQIVVSTFFWYQHRPLLTYLTLMLFAVADMVLFAVMPDVLVCYRCQARHRAPGDTSHGTFDHETAERYRQERLKTGAD